MLAPDSEIARKHIAISLRVKRIASSCCSKWGSYVATYTAGSAGQAYQRIEQDSGEEFWSIKTWTPPPHRRLKDPDVLITQGERVKFLVEVKWGAIQNRPNTDLSISAEEREKIAHLLSGSALCRVRGPCVKDRRRYRSTEFQIQKDYWTDNTTRLVLVSDFALANRLLGPPLEAVKLWERTNANILVADIDTRVGNIPSLRELLEMDLKS